MSKTSQAVRLEMRLDPAMGAEIEDWRSKQRPVPPRAEAVRRLIARGLQAERAADAGAAPGVRMGEGKGDE